MTNGWVDIKNADVILAMGGNPAENHPVGFKWFMEAKRTRGAKLVVVDPRFTRTEAVADYVKSHRNGPYIVNDKYAFNDGLFSGWDPSTKKYVKDSWAYEGDPAKGGAYHVDDTLQNPRSVFQLLKQHVERYTPEM